MSINTEEELADALNKEEDTIEIEGDLGKKILKIKATGKAAWIIAFGAISVAATAAIVTAGSGGTTAPATVPISGIAAIGAAGALGVPATTSAVLIAVAAGGVGVLNKLRKYKIIENNGDKLILKRN